MKRKKGVTLVLLLLTVTILGGCAGFKYGYTKNRAIDSYLLVDEATESFGFKRMKLNQGYNSSLKGFIKEHGLPDFIYEYENEKGRDSIKMFYVQNDIAYVYESQSWVSNSLALKEYRPLTYYEKLTYEELLKNYKPKPKKKPWWKFW